jgi:hypothetical protein
MADYPNRSDLRNPMAKTAAPGQTYGEAAKQIASQQAVPMGASPSDVAVSSAAPSQPGPMPGQVVDMGAETEFPDRMMNNNFKAPSPQPQFNFGDPIMDELRQLYFVSPNEDLARLLSAYDRYFR